MSRAILASLPLLMLSAAVTLGQKPEFSSSSVVNAASYQPVLAPGSIATTFGKNLAVGTEEAKSLPLPRILGGTVVRVGQTLAPLFYVSPDQINFQFPSSRLCPFGDCFYASRNERCRAGRNGPEYIRTLHAGCLGMWSGLGVQCRSGHGSAHAEYAGQQRQARAVRHHLWNGFGNPKLLAANSGWRAIPAGSRGPLLNTIFWSEQWL